MRSYGRRGVANAAGATRRTQPLEPSPRLMLAKTLAQPRRAIYRWTLCSRLTLSDERRVTLRERPVLLTGFNTNCGAN